MLEIAIGIGGTFTGIVCLRDQQCLFLAKVPTTPHDLVHGVPLGVAFDGPAIIEQPDTTAVVYTGYPCHVDTAGSLLLTSTAH